MTLFPKLNQKLNMKFNQKFNMMPNQLLSHPPVEFLLAVVTANRAEDVFGSWLLEIRTK